MSVGGLLADVERQVSADTRAVSESIDTFTDLETHLYLRMCAICLRMVMNVRRQKYMTRMGQKTGTSKSGMNEATREKAIARVALCLRGSDHV
jgi:hypothetical protein